jgi:hypothetical protein
LGRRVGFGLKFVGELIELVEIDAGPEAERVRNDFRRRVLPLLRLFAETSTQRPVNHVLERHPQFPGTPLQKAGKIIVDGKSCAHINIMRIVENDVKASIADSSISRSQAFVE